MQFPSIPGFEIKSVISQGGMGTVYRAVQEDNGGEVALKILHPHLAAVPEFIKRFHREAKVAEKLARPKVARIITTGEEKGAHYIAMELVHGEMLTERLAKSVRQVPLATLDVFKGSSLPEGTLAEVSTPLPIKTVVKMIRQIGAVLEEARQLGLVHRDIKPDNIIIDEDENIKLLDFGIAKDTETLHSVLSMTGQTLGTPPYMSPEQCKGAKGIDVRSDLYSLGVVAYHCLCGHLPFAGPTTAAFINQHINEIARPLHEANPDAPRDLSEIIRRLLAKDPKDRHQTPSELIEDLNRIERGEPPFKIYQVKRARAFRTTQIAAVGAAAVAVAVVVVLLIGWLGNRAAQAEFARMEERIREVADRGDFEGAIHRIDRYVRENPDKTGVMTRLASLRAEISLTAAREQDRMKQENQDRYDQLVLQGKNKLDAGDYDGAHLLFRQAGNCFPTREAAELVGQAEALLKAEREAGVLLSDVRAMLAKGEYRKAGEKAGEGVARFSGTACAQELASLREEADGKYFEAVATRERKFEKHFEKGLQDYQDNDLRKALPSFREAAKYDDTRQAAEKVTELESRLSIHDSNLEKGRELLSDEEKLDEVLILLREARKAWDTPALQDLIARTQESISSRKLRVAVVDFDVSGDVGAKDAGRSVAELLIAKLVGKFDVLERSRLVSLLNGLNLQMADLTDPDKAAQLGRTGGVKYVVLGSVIRLDKLSLAARLVAVQGGAVIQTAEVSADDIGALEPLVSEVARILSMSDTEKKTYLVEKTNYLKYIVAGNKALGEKKYQKAAGFFEKALAVKETAEVRERLAAALQTQRALTVKTLRTLKGHTDTANSVDFSPDGKLLASASDDNTVCIWNPHTGERLRTLKGHTGDVSAVSFSPTGNMLASASWDGTVRIWNPHTSECMQILKEHAGEVASVAFSPDGKLLASGSHDNSVRLWNAQTGECIRTLDGHEYSVYSVAFSPDGNLLASGSVDWSVRIWNAHTGDCQRVLKGHTSVVNSVAFSPDGKSLASAGRDKAICIWNTRTGEQVCRLKRHTGSIYTVKFSPAGGLLFSAGHDRGIHIWNPRTGECVRVLEGHAGPARCLALSPDGGLLASASEDETIMIWAAPGKDSSGNPPSER